MDDLISRQAATSIPIMPKEHRKIFKSIDDAFETGWNEALSCVNMLPSAQPEPHWIPCSERLPEYNESVLTWDGYVFCIEKRIPYIRDDDGEPIESDWWVGDEYDEYESEFYPNLRDGDSYCMDDSS